MLNMTFFWKEKEASFMEEQKKRATNALQLLFVISIVAIPLSVKEFLPPPRVRF